VTVLEEGRKTIADRRHCPEPGRLAKSATIARPRGIRRPDSALKS